MMHLIFIGSLKGKVVWIIGASTGIGEYLAYEVLILKYLKIQFKPGTV